MSKPALNRASRCCSVRFLGTISTQIFLIPSSSVYQTNGFPVHVHFTSNHTGLIFNRIEQVLLPCCFVTCPFCWWSSAALLTNKGSVFRKHFVRAKGLCFRHCIISKGLLKCSMCCDGIVTEFNTHKMAYRCAMFHNEVHKHFRTCQAPTLHWGIAQPCHCKWGWRKDQGQRLSVLANCNIACTARRKLISLLYRWPLYNVNFATLSDPNKLTKHNTNSATIIHLWNIFTTLQFRFVNSCFLQFSRVPSPVGKDHKVSVVKCSVDSTKKTGTAETFAL